MDSPHAPWPVAPFLSPELAEFQQEFLNFRGQIGREVQKNPHVPVGVPPLVSGFLGKVLDDVMIQALWAKGRLNFEALDWEELRQHLRGTVEEALTILDDPFLMDGQRSETQEIILRLIQEELKEALEATVKKLLETLQKKP